ncbi:hypothetical protein ZOSMA_78G00560 [Zostera marina]|uniref:Uncharacterized protein n=1 Tax=Zostera marina TaxID=29655 RepID=A0A0K9NNE8_ZOSMR|nr:hypothetical protein ZOSMA_78G00560 [Zostera marina]
MLLSGLFSSYCSFPSFPSSRFNSISTKSFTSHPRILIPICASRGPVKKRKNSPEEEIKTKRNVKDADGRGRGRREKATVEVLPSSKPATLQKRSNSSHPSPLPKPPAGFIVDALGKVILVSNKRIATIVDSSNNLPLECVIRRVFQSSRGDDCILMCPIDMPVQLLKSTNFEGWAAVSDDEIEGIIPTAAYALAKIHMHLVVSGFCYTARGGFCYSEDDILEFGTDDGDSIDGLPAEGIEITCFHQDGTHYMIYSPSDPLLFVATKNEEGELKIADDDLLEDPAIISAIDEETEFNALVEEEAALLESLMGER